ncbi:MAG: hypothetical protein JW912_00275 [Sedimentisphaerales bacterium]|nr:hypothetical protein [Sedimentisphaerales bacterium]
MKQWAFFTVLLYALLVVLVFFPFVIELTFLLADEIFGNGDTEDLDVVGNILEMYKAWQFWIWGGVILLIQASLLLIPVQVSEEPLVPKRHIRITVVTIALLFSILLWGFVCSIAFGIFGDDVLVDPFVWLLVGFIVIAWIFWSYIFFRYAKKRTPELFARKGIGWLIKGSVLELLVAVPSHIIVRRRDDCCAPGFTSLGIAAGIVIMLIAFGPGLYFLFSARFERMRPKSQKTNGEAAEQTV